MRGYCQKILKHEMQWKHLSGPGYAVICGHNKNQRKCATSGHLQSEKSTRGLKNDKPNISAKLIGHGLLHELKSVPAL